MREYSIETIDYRIDIADRIRRALRGAEGVGVRGEGQRAAVITRDGEAREQLCMALCRVSLKHIRLKPPRLSAPPSARGS